MLVTSETRGLGVSCYAAVNGVQLHYREAGQGPLVVLLHGFPQFWYAWKDVIPALADAGYRVIAPDLRGYNLSGKPAGVEAYTIDTLADDIAALIQHTGERRAHVVGHDWGGAIAWHLAMRHRALVDHLVVINGPHPRAFRRELRTLGQLRRSRYAFFFQLPRLPEAALSRDDFAAVRRILREEPMRPDAFTEEDIDRYVAALARPWALTSALNYYRASFRYRPAHPPNFSSRIDAPTMLIWGERDRHLGNRMSEGIDEWVPNLTVERLPDVSHWVMADAPADVERLLGRFLP
jgi:pimeloyl-ACP methyl ester carboxylesterase